MSDYVNGFIERKRNGEYQGKINIDGVLIPNVQAVYFEENGKKYLWLKRSKVLDYDAEEGLYVEREARPSFEAYMEKTNGETTVEYRGVFPFLRFKYSIVGIWDRVLGTDERRRLNLYVERLPMSEQTIINKINDTRYERERVE